jgi:hypothetical protein
MNDNLLDVIMDAFAMAFIAANDNRTAVAVMLVGAGTFGAVAFHYWMFP